MDYHKDRFEDYSLMVFKDEKLVAVLPANRVEDKLFSHQGLSYGGLIVKNNLRFEIYLNIVKSLLNHLKKIDVTVLTLKSIPVVYSNNLSLEFDYLLQFLDFKTTKVDSYFVIDTKYKYKPNRNRKRAIALADKLKITITTNGLQVFWDTILTKNLNEKYNVNPVHSFKEILLLKKRFPNNIKPYFATFDDKIVAGVVLFVTKNVVHFQYSSGDENKDKTGALDYLFDYVIKKYSNYKYISFGSSSTDKSLKINTGLAYWKESFGASNIPQFTHCVNIKGSHKLDSVFL